MFLKLVLVAVLYETERERQGDFYIQGEIKAVVLLMHLILSNFRP